MASSILYAQDDFDRFSPKPEVIENLPDDDIDSLEDDFDDIIDDQIEPEPLEDNPDFSRSKSRKSAPEQDRFDDNRRNDRPRETRRSRFSQNQEKNVFGRSNKSTITPFEKNPQYVKLNPETGFGPEIVQSFDFPNADILDVTKHMQKLTGINLILDKDVKGKISIVAPTPITVGDAWKAYLAALNMAGYSLIKTGNFYRIISSRDVRYTPTKIYTGDYIPDTETYMMKVIALKHVNASEITRNFRPFMSRYGRIIDIPQTNTIIITDTGANINRLMKLVKFLDVAGFDESLQILPVKNTSAQELAKLLDSILQDSKGSSTRGKSRSSRLRAKKGGAGMSISKIIAEPRTNSIIAMADAAGAKHLKNLIKKLDVQKVSTGSGKIQVYYLQHGDAESLAKTLTTLISGAKSNSSSSRRGSLSRFSRNNNNNSKESLFTNDVKVTADKATNSLVVTASPTDWLTVKEVINKLDVPRLQVYVEGLILETNVDRNNTFGTSYLGAYGRGAAQRFGFDSNKGLLDLAGGNIASLGGFFGGFGIGRTKDVKVTLPGGGEQTIQASSVNGLIKAIASKTNANILATPQILATDNTEASFSVGDSVPVQNSSVGNGGVTNFNASEQKAVLELKITPQINKVTRFIRLKIDQKIEEFKDTSQSTPQGQAKTVRAANTEVIVRDQDTIAMGGLMRNRKTEDLTKVPLLGDIPVLGWLFKSKTKIVSKVNLLLFLTPRIISPYEKTASQLTLDKLKLRNKAVNQGSIEEDPHADDVAALEDKLNRQIEGPVYDKSLVQDFNGDNSSLTTDQIEAPDYEEITQGIEQQ
jgi:general secretion pathway protein D